MEKKRMISDAARELEVETHVLRYWEEELRLPIPRNDMGHRCYGEKEMRLLKEIKEQKEKGILLKDIKDKIYQLQKEEEEKRENLAVQSELQREKMMQFQEIMTKIMGQALKQHQQELSRQMGQQIATQVVKEMDYHFREQEALENARYQKFDELMRSYQKARAEIGATREKRGIFGRKKRRTT